MSVTIISDYGFCIVKDEYFKDYPHPQHMDNKNETRPYFLQDEMKKYENPGPRGWRTGISG